MYLVTGGAGFIGSNVVAALAEQGRRVAVCDTLGADEKWRNVAKHDLYDFVAPSALEPWLSQHKGALEAIVHMGAVSATTERNADLIVDANFRLSLRLWEWSAAADVPFIYASSAAVYGDGAHGFDDEFTDAAMGRLRPLNPYGWSKLAFDRRALRAVKDGERTPPKWAGLRFFNVYGPNEYHKGSMRSVIAVNYDRIAQGEPLRLFRSYRSDYSDGEQKRDFVFVDDCMAIILWMLDNEFPPSVYNVGAGQARTWLDLGRAMFAAAGLPPRIEFVEMPETLRPRYQYLTEARMTKLRGAGYDGVMISLEAGVTRYIREFLSRPDPYR